MNAWHQCEEGVFLFRDSCNVYAVCGGDGAWLIVNAGTGAAAEHLHQLGDPGDVTVVLTHHFRDHSAGVEQFRRQGAQCCAPFGERDHLSGAQSAMRGKQIYFQYDLAWDHFAPIEPLGVDRWLMDYEQLDIAGLPLAVIPSPGVTMGAAAYLVMLPSGRKIAFSGELMCSPGRLARLSPLQYNYNDLTGAENVLLSCERVLAANPAKVFPSIGEPFGDFRPAIAQLRHNLGQFERVQPGIAARMAAAPPSGLEQVLPRLYRATGCSAETHFIVGRTGRVLALDYGYDISHVRFPNRLVHWTRRPLLHSVDALQEQTGRGRIDTVIPTHYHDDHVAGITILQRLFGTEVWAGGNFADMLEQPRDYDRPCLWPEPIKVSRRLPLGEKFHWEDVAITLHPMQGHTEFSTLICLEFDGHRVAHTGDQIFYLNPKDDLLTRPEDGGVFTNHVYRNGLAIGGYSDCVRHLRDFDPEIILSGHFKPYRPTAETWAKLEAAGAAFDEIHRAIMPLGDSEPHFGAESQSAKLFPYQLPLHAPETKATFHGWVLNPFNRRVTAVIQLVTPPAGWHATPLKLILAPREKRDFETILTVVRSAETQRQLVALDLTIEGQPFGQVAEAWVVVD